VMFMADVSLAKRLYWREYKVGVQNLKIGYMQCILP